MGHHCRVHLVVYTQVLTMSDLIPQYNHVWRQRLSHIDQPSLFVTGALFIIWMSPLGQIVRLFPMFDRVYTLWSLSRSIKPCLNYEPTIVVARCLNTTCMDVNVSLPYVTWCHVVFTTKSSSVNITNAACAVGSVFAVVRCVSLYSALYMPVPNTDCRCDLMAATNVWSVWLCADIFRTRTSTLSLLFTCRAFTDVVVSLNDDATMMYYKNTHNTHCIIRQFNCVRELTLETRYTITVLIL